MNLKAKFSAIDLLIGLALFHILGNIFWIKLNNAPPAWDAAYHTKGAFQFYYFWTNAFHGQFLWHQFGETFTDFYAPLVKLLTSFLLLFSPNLKFAEFTGTIYFIATLYVIYLLGKELFHKPAVGVLSAAIFSFYQMVYDYSRWLLLDIPLTFFTALTVYFLIKSKWLENKKYTYFAALAFAAAVLTKVQAFMYIIVPAGFALYFTYKRETSFRGIFQRHLQNWEDKILSHTPLIHHKKKIWQQNHIVTAFFLFLIIILIWIIPSIKNILFYYRLGSTPEVGDPTNLADLTTWFYYPKLFINYISTFYIFLIHVVAAVFFFRRTRGYRLFIGLNIIVTYVIFTIFPNKDLRFLFPMFVYTALMCSQGLYELYSSWNKAGIAIITSVFIFDVALYMILSFGIPFQKNYVSYGVFEYIGDVAFLNLTNFPVRKYDTRKWPYEEIAKDFSYESGGKFISIFWIPNFDEFNDNVMRMQLAREGLTDIEIRRADTIDQFKNEQELVDYIAPFKYFLYTPGEVGVSYQLDRIAYEQIRDKVRGYLDRKEAEVLYTYYLPTGQKIELVKMVGVARPIQEENKINRYQEVFKDASAN